MGLVLMQLAGGRTQRGMNLSGLCAKRLLRLNASYVRSSCAVKMNAYPADEE
jgi:hypothetical protein